MMVKQQFDVPFQPEVVRRLMDLTLESYAPKADKYGVKDLKLEWSTDCFGVLSCSWFGREFKIECIITEGKFELRSDVAPEFQAHVGAVINQVRSEIDSYVKAMEQENLG
jgi:hypothetical protein